MTKQDLINDIYKTTGIDKGRIGITVEALMVTIKTSLIKNETIYLRGFGTFGNKKRAKKKARNITKNTSILVPEHFIPSFNPSKEFKAAVKSKKK